MTRMIKVLMPISHTPPKSSCSQASLLALSTTVWPRAAVFLMGNYIKQRCMPLLRTVSHRESQSLLWDNIPKPKEALDVSCASNAGEE